MAEIRRIIDIEFSNRRDKAQREAERRKKELDALIPQLSEIDAQITLTGIRYARALISEKEASAEELTDIINGLNTKKESLLKAHGFPANYLEPHYMCTICSDRGYITDLTGLSLPCSCYQNLYLEQLYKQSNLINDGKTGFEYFDESYFSAAADRKKYQLDISPREQIREIKCACHDFIDNFLNKDYPDLFFFGETGTGKTFMAKSIGLELIRKGYTVLYLSSTMLFSIIHQYRISSDKEGFSGEQAYKNLTTANLLILDDLGTEPASDSKFAELLTLLEMRKAQGKAHIAKTIISSNFNLKRLAQEYNERIASRIVGEFKILKFIGDDIRILKKVENLS